MGNNSVLKFIFHLSRFPVYRGSVLGRFYCTSIYMHGLLCIYPHLRWPPKNMSAKKRFYYEFHTLNTQSMADSNYLHQSVPLSNFTVSAFIFLTLTPNIPILFTAIPQHITISPIHCNGQTALPKTLQSLLVRCAAMLLWSTLTK